MSIKGLTDRGLSFPEIGQIRKGAKKTTNAPGKDLTYFRTEFDEKETKAAETFYRIYGDKPQAIRIILPFNEIDRMWDAWLEAYTAGRMVARSDGEFYTYRVDTKTGEIIVKNGINVKTGQKEPYLEDVPAGYDYKGNKVFCKPVGRLKVILPELERAAYLTVMTTSIHDIANISDQLRAFATLNRGQIAGIPLILRRRPKAISVPKKDGGRARMKKYMLSIEADPEWVKMALQETKRLALPGNGFALPEADYPLLDEGDLGDIDELPVDSDDGELETEGDVIEGETVEEPQEQPQATNGNERPYAPAVVKDKLDKLSETARINDWTIKTNAKNMIAVNLEKCFDSGDAADKRHTVMRYLLGVSSMRDVDDYNAYALSKWIDAQPDDTGDWNPNPMTVKEAQAIYTEALKAEGQKELL